MEHRGPPDSAQPLKIRVDYMLWFPGLPACAQLECETASCSTEMKNWTQPATWIYTANNWNIA